MRTFINQNVSLGYMGRIKTKMVKRVTKQMLRENPEGFSADFAANKPAIAKMAIVRSKKLRNILAGSLSRQVKLKKDVQDYTA